MSIFKRIDIYLGDIGPWLLMGLTTLFLGIVIAYYGGK